ncbi:MAG: NUDIX domain-containing protein [Geothrix sp.]|nr:NUDIX domain-containing protein [Geothrix sp.]
MMDIVLALIRRDGRWFLQRRAPANPVLPGLWEFPGGKVEPGETHEAALRRELWEEVGLVAVEARRMPDLGGGVRLCPFLVDAEGDPRTDLAWGWFTAEEMLRLPFPPRNAALIGLMAQGEGARPGSIPPI